MPRETRHGAGHSNVGHGAFYESQDQKNEPQSVINQRQRYEDKKTGPNRTENYSTNDPQEIGSRMQAQSANANTQDRSHHAGGYDAEADLYKRDPTGPATFHGLTPSRGADVDKNLKQEDELRLKEKGY